MNMMLNGDWEVGTDRHYDRYASVPGLVDDPKRMSEGTVWYRRVLSLPDGDWTHASLKLNGARFCPQVWVNGELIGQSAGGMAPVVFALAHREVRPGADVMLEIALQSLRDVPGDDASRIPDADMWRSNVSSCLWDRVELRLHRDVRLARVLPCTDEERGGVVVKWHSVACRSEARMPQHVRVRLASDDGMTAAESSMPCSGWSGEVFLKHELPYWSPECPSCYRLNFELLDGNGVVLDEDEMTYGRKRFAVHGKQFRLNGKPVTFRSGSLVWHRWVRDPESAALAFDAAWFETQIVRRLKAHGANAIRFHLGTPPEYLLDLCDRHGLMVQVEWLFFHGIRASRDSMVEQWRSWLDLCMRHPSICIVHPWNETDGDEVQIGFQAIEELVPEYPPLVVAHRDVLHVHKYWWSLFENVGLYYDSADQFPMPIVADEFGGNYLDGSGDPGQYPTIRESLLRFLGRSHTREQRLQLHTEANTQIAEYWRRIGAAGFSPFCMLGTPEDGNHHFLGPLADGNPKPVWDGLTAAYSPQSVSLELWDRNFAPGQQAAVPLHGLNETDQAADLLVELRIVSQESGDAVFRQNVSVRVDAWGHTVTEVWLKLPEEEGEWRVCAELINRPSQVERPVISQWRVRTLQVRLPKALRTAVVAVLPGEEELVQLLRNLGVNVMEWRPGSEADVIAATAVSWPRIENDRELRLELERGLLGGTTIALLGIGPVWLGQGYLEGGELGPLQGAMRVDEPATAEVELMAGVSVRFTELPEPESCVHPSETDSRLWDGLPQQATWLWNGLRGGIVAPACDMEPAGLGAADFLKIWQGRGADAELIKAGRCRAYELSGFYVFSEEDDLRTEEELRAKVRFLFEDAPALQNSLNPNAPVQRYDLGALYRGSADGLAQSMTPLASCGKGLTRTPAVSIGFGEGRGTLLLSQLMVNGRLCEGFGSEGLYGLRADPAAQQMTLNMLAYGLHDVEECGA